MAREALWEFIRSIKGSQDLQAQCAGFLDASRTVADFVALGRRCGFHFTDAEALAYFREAVVTSDGRELGEEELNGVAGGMGSVHFEAATFRLRLPATLLAASSPPD